MALLGERRDASSSRGRSPPSSTPIAPARSRSSPRASRRREGQPGVPRVTSRRKLQNGGVRRAARGRAGRAAASCACAAAPSTRRGRRACHRRLRRRREATRRSDRSPSRPNGVGESRTALHAPRRGRDRRLHARSNRRAPPDARQGPRAPARRRPSSPRRRTRPRRPASRRRGACKTTCTHRRARRRCPSKIRTGSPRPSSRCSRRCAVCLERVSAAGHPSRRDPALRGERAALAAQGRRRRLRRARMRARCTFPTAARRRCRGGIGALRVSLREVALRLATSYLLGVMLRLARRSANVPNFASRFTCARYCW